MSHFGTKTGSYGSKSGLSYQRENGRIGAGSVWETALVRIFQAGARISSLWSHRGFAAGCAMLRPLTPQRTITVSLNKDAAFAFPFGDGYWSLLLDPNYRYERDIEFFFRSIADVDYALIDCGANFGYWSTLTSSAPYGSHSAVAIEPSRRNYEILSNNARLNGNRFSVLNNAIGAAHGTARLSGSKHEAMSIAGSPDSSGEDVTVIPLDSLIDTHIDLNKKLVLKLDIEGVEVEALGGGTKLLASDCVVICEEHGNDKNHTLSRHILANTPLKLFCYDPATQKFEHLEDVSPLDRIKQSSNWGYNILATASPFWEAKIRAIPTGKQSAAAFQVNSESR